MSANCLTTPSETVYYPKELEFLLKGLLILQRHLLFYQWNVLRQNG
jgi:hypothetical protein